MKKTLLIGLLLSIFIGQEIDAQVRRDRISNRERVKKEKVTQRFSAGIIAGFNYSQLDGDGYTGYDKRGITAGFKVVTHFTNYVTFDVEFLYTQKGAKIENELSRLLTTNRKDRIIALDYVDVPFFLKFFPDPKKTPLFFEVGGIISRKIDSSVSEKTNDFTRYILANHESNFNSNEFSLLAGGGYKLGSKASIRFRFNFGMTKLFYDPDPAVRFEGLRGSAPTYGLSFLRNYSFSVMAGYDIF